MKRFTDTRFVPLFLAAWIICSAALLRAGFLNVSNFDAIVMIPLPPSQSSAEVRNEIDMILRLQETRTPAEVAVIQADANITVLAFTNTLGSWFSPTNLPVTFALFDAVGKDTSFFSSTAKKQFNRPRPFKVDSRVTTAVDTNSLPDPSYPSGHSTRGTVFALVLAEIMPDLRDSLLERGRAIGWERVVAGVHYPSDVAAGRFLGQNIAMQFFQNPAFRVELDRARQECNTFRAARAAQMGGCTN